MRKVGMGAALALLSLLVMVSPAAAVPPLPSGFWGIITMNGAAIQSGSSLTAWVEGIECGRAKIFVYEGTTAYSISVTGDDLETPGREGGRDGEIVHFKLNGVPLAATAIWQGGNGFARLDMQEYSLHRSTTTPRTYLMMVAVE